jgi:phospholipase C
MVPDPAAIAAHPPPRQDGPPAVQRQHRIHTMLLSATPRPSVAGAPGGGCSPFGHGWVRSQYYASTANPHHLPPSSVDAIGHTDQANHQYDLSDFHAALVHGNLPAVSYLKAANYQDGHAGYSDPIDEQHFVVDTINALQQSKEWKSTAVVIAYDDSDGWYDHVMPPILNPSRTAVDALNGPGVCGTANHQPLGGYAARCGYGPRLPLLIVSPYARTNFVDSTLTDQSSILRFVEDNWSTGRVGDSSFDALAGPLTAMFDFNHRSDRKVILDPNTGAPVNHDR